MLEKFQPKPDLENYNVTKKSPWRIFGKFLLIAAGALIVLFIVFLNISKFLTSVIDLQEEAELFGGIKYDFGEINEAKTKYAQNVLDKISDQSLSYKVVVVCNQDFNAVTVLGGKIYVFSGLLDKMKSENELAFVLAHEMSHIKHRDVMEKMVTVMPANIFAAVLFGNSVNISGLNSALRLRYDKNTELRADTEALGRVDQYYGHTGGVLDFFKELETQGNDFWTVFSDHPMTSTRKENIKNLIDEKYPAKKELVPINQKIQGECK